MTVILSEEEVLSLLSMDETVKCMEQLFEKVGEAQAINTMRTRTLDPPFTINALHGALPYLGRGGAKVYLTSKNAPQFVFLLFDTKGDGGLLAVMGADNLGRYRTGATSAVATKYLFGGSSFSLGLAGTGRQAMTQVSAIQSITKLDHVSVWSPNKEHREAFAAKVTASGLTCTAAETVREAFRDREVVTSITSATQPFIGKDDVAMVRHMNVCGSNKLGNREIDNTALAHFKSVCVDERSQSMREAGDLVQPAQERAFDWRYVLDLGSVVRFKQKVPEPTMFKSVGLAIEDVALASLIYDKALASNEIKLREVKLTDEGPVALGVTKEKIEAPLNPV